MAYQLPEWARQQPYLLAGPNNPALTGAQIGNTSVSGGGMGLLDYEGFYNNGIGQFSGGQIGNGDSQSWSPGKYDEFNDWLRSTGQSLYEANGGNNENARWLQDAQGNITSEPQVGSMDDSQFWNAAMLAAAVTGANVYGAGAGAGGAGADAGIQTMGTIAPGAGPVAPLAATGQLSTAPLITASIPQVGGAVGAAGGLLSAAAPATNAALAESAVGTAGYGASSAGAGGGAGQLASGLDLGSLGTGLLDYIKANPKIVGGLLGAVGGATGGGGSGGEAEAYTGPMPTISRGGWQPRAQAQMMALPTFGQSLNANKGVQNSGLWRFNKG
jgi:hypothetical protein